MPLIGALLTQRVVSGRAGGDRGDSAQSPLGELGEGDSEQSLYRLCDFAVFD